MDTHEVHARLILEAIEHYDFRELRDDEDPGQYLDALVRHVDDRDHAAAHELRVGKPQADWSPEDVEAFRRRLDRPRNPAYDDPTIPFACPVLTHPDRVPVTDEALLAEAERALAFAMDFRRDDPTKDFRVMATVVLTTGELKTAMPGRDDRFRAVRKLAQILPLHGYVVIADVFIHGIGPERATKQDAFVVHVGSRTMRRVIVQRYRVTDGRTVFDDRFDVPQSEMRDDPYAGLLVSVPMPSGPPS